VGRSPRGVGATGLARLLPEVWRSAWVHFGWGNVVAYPLLYQLLAAFCAFCLAGWLYARLRRQLALSITQRTQIAMLALAGLLALLSLFSFQRVATFGSDARYRFVVLPAFALLLVAGLSGWLPKAWAHCLGPAGIAGGALFSALMLGVYLIPVYALPPRLPETRLPADLRRLDWQLGDHIRLLGYRLTQERVRPGEVLEVTLYWQTMTPVARDYSVFVHLLGPEQQPWGSVDSFPGLGNYPTRAWRPGEVIVDRYRLQVVPTAQAPSLAWLEAGLYDYVSGERLPLNDAQGRPLDTPRFARLAIGRRTTEPPAAQVPVDASFGGQFRLLGYDGDHVSSGRSGIQVAPGAEIRLTFYWQAQARPTADYARFLHLVNGYGQIVAQHDALLGDRRYPTGLWVAGDWVADSAALLLPADLSAGEYVLLTGLYDPGTSQRLPLASGSDHLRLLTVEVRSRDEEIP
jgi:hypothetical protein